MGIKGLTSYINRNSDRFYQPHQLHDTTVVIDGCSLACQLYSNVSSCHSAFGGDYDKYAAGIKNFFSLLKHCNVTPIVIIDGGYETRKLKTVQKRLKENFSRVKICTPNNQATVCVFPLMLMVVFKQTLSKLGIKFVQADFEGDSEIAALARHLDCPVLSFDSDFYIYDVKYIPFPTVNLSLSQMMSDGLVKNYLSCKIYDVDYFLAKFGGLDKSLLPLVAILLGNDYVPRCVFSQLLIKQGKTPKRFKNLSGQQRKIFTVLEWLRDETLSSAIVKILRRSKKERRDYLQNVIKSSVADYNLWPSELISYFGLKVLKPDVCDSSTMHQEQFSDDIFSEGEESDDLEESETSQESECSENDECEENSEDELNDVVSASNFPDWLREKFRKGGLPSFVSDIYHLRLYICKSQVGDVSLDDSQIICYPILQVICGFLFSDGEEASDSNHIICYLRRSVKRLEKIELEATTKLPCLSSFPPLACLPNLPASDRKNILYCVLGITSAKDKNILESFGGKWQLFAMAVVYWAKSAINPKVTNCHLQAIIICMIALGVIDKKIGRIRHQKDITKRKSKNLQRIHQNSSVSASEHQTRGHTQEDSILSKDILIEDLLLKVLEADCWNSAEFFLQCHQVGVKLLSNTKQFSPLLVHSFSQFQACLNQAMVLNSLLEYPVPQCQVAEIFSGNVVYIAFSNFNTRSNVESYVRNQMCSSPSVYDVYKALWDKFACLVPNLTVLLRKSKRKAKRKHSESVASNVSGSEVVIDTESEPVYDANNRFSILGIF